MKISLGISSVIIVVLAVVLLAVEFSTRAAEGGGAQNVTPGISTSRYALFSGTYMMETVPDRPQPGVFKLDTYSGDTWILEAAIGPEEAKTFRWVAVPDRKKTSTTLPPSPPAIPR